jgi:hypothetical protein
MHFAFSLNRRCVTMLLHVLILFSYCASLGLTAALLPERLAFYYGYPSAINGAAGNLDEAIAAFDMFDLVVFGDTLELPQFVGSSGQVSTAGCSQNSHNDHDNVQVIINGLLGYEVQVFGYVSIGGENTARRCYTDGPPAPLTLDEIKSRIDMWHNMGVTGVFLDEADYGFGTSRGRQNAVIDYAHAKSLRVFINGYNAQDLFGTTMANLVTYHGGVLQGAISTETMNEFGIASSLGSQDIYLLEHYQLVDGNWEDVAVWQKRTDIAASYRVSHGIEIATITTQADVYPTAAYCEDLFRQYQYDYAWWSTVLYGFEYMGWGEPSGFSARGTCQNILLPHEVSYPSYIDDFTGQVTHPESGSSIHYRNAANGVIQIDTTAHTGRFVAL